MSDSSNILATKTMNITEAAAFLKIHPVTLSVKAASGEIPAAKIGKRWVFLQVDLVSHIRSKYQLRALEGEHERNQQKCHSTSAKTPLHGGLKSPLVEKQYKEALGLSQKVKLKSSMTN